eukprot:m51a1_g6839 putative uridine diphosphate glucose dehydrogenase (469) ;mRNA; f:67760-69797
MDGSCFGLDMADKRQTICCIGAGYVGGPSMVVLAEHNPDVATIVIDRDQKRVEAWNSDELPLYEPGLAPLVAQYRGKNLAFTCDAAAAIQQSDIIFICVNTPTKGFGNFGQEGYDLGYYEAAARDIAKYSTGPKVIVEKSTVPIRTADMLRKVLTANAVHPDAKFEIVSNPEFLSEGTAIKNLEVPDRVLIGSIETPEGIAAADRLSALYEKWIPKDRILRTNVWSSELTKLAANALLAQRISSVNALAALCEQTGADVTEVARVCGADRRIGPNFLNASVGFGGSCFPKDLCGLVYLCEARGLSEVAEYWRQVLRVNDYTKTRFARRMVTEMFGSVRGKNICVLGFAFKKDTGDYRDTPAADVIRILLEERANVFVYDPKVDPVEITRMFPSVTVERTPYAAAHDTHAIAVVTEWDEFRGLDYERVYASMAKPAFIFDGRNILDHHALGRIGFKVYAIGRSYPQYSV